MEQNLSLKPLDQTIGILGGMRRRKEGMRNKARIGGLEVGMRAGK
jgi:hypothetical protein